MKTYYNFISEKYKQFFGPNDDVEIFELLKNTTIFDYIMNNSEIHRNKLIYREDDNNSSNIVLIDPKEITRISPHASNNIYNLYLSNSELWSAFPKRNKSLICGNLDCISYRSGYSFNHVYIVLPFNPKIAVCNDSDIWFSFSTSYYNLNALTQQLDMLFNEKKITYSDKDWDIFKNSLNLLDSKTTPSEKEKYFSEVHDEDLRNQWINNKISTLEFLNVLLDPKTSLFKIFDYNSSNLMDNNELVEILNTENEIWLDSKSLLVKYDYFDEFINNAKKYYNVTT
jgi:hypothetical protein